MSTSTAPESARHDQADPPKPVKQPKSSFWTLKRKPKGDDDAVEHPPFVPTLPHVNLIPPAVHDAVRATKLRRWFILAGLLLLSIIAGIWYLQAGQISAAEAQYATAQLANEKVQSDLRALDPVKSMYNEINRLQVLVDQSLASQPVAATVIRHLQDAGASVGTVELTRAEVSYTGIPKPGTGANTCPNPDPFNSEITIGCISFDATAGKRDEVSALLRTLEADPLFVGPYVNSSTIEQTGAAAAGVGPAGENPVGGQRSAERVTFSGTVGVSLAALQTPLTEEQVQAILTPPTPTPQPTAEGGQ